MWFSILGRFLTEAWIEIAVMSVRMKWSIGRFLTEAWIEILYIC